MQNISLYKNSSIINHNFNLTLNISANASLQNQISRSVTQRKNSGTIHSSLLTSLISKNIWNSAICTTHFSITDTGFLFFTVSSLADIQTSKLKHTPRDKFQCTVLRYDRRSVRAPSHLTG